jgi:uncharacterized protein (UPF0335 family)
MTDAKLKSLVERAEKIIEERKAVSSDLKDIFTEAKSAGYDVRTMRGIIKERDMDAADRAEREALMDAYRHALDMVAASVSNGDMSLREAARQSGFSKSAIHRASHQMRDGVSGTAREMVADDLGDPLWVVDRDRAKFRERIKRIAATVKPQPELMAALTTLLEDDLAFPTHLDRRAEVSA